MSKQWVLRGLLAAVVLQSAILAGEYFNAMYPLWTGKEIQIKVVPRDPRSLFRGNYAHLNYDISRVTLVTEESESHPRQNEVIYVKLKPTEKGELFEFSSASLKKPVDGLFLRGRIRNPRWHSTNAQYQVDYGIEAFFAPKDKALALERQLRDGGIAVVRIAENGKAALVDVIANEPKLGQAPRLN